jgi:hypothetical protein
VEKAGRLAAQLAELHARQQTASVIAVGGLDGWIAEALQTMQLPQALAPSVKRIILAESGGIPRAINRWDSNARRGTPSHGLMQTIPATFRTYVHPDLSARPIVDPVANITAGVRYMIDRYGMETLEAGVSAARHGHRQGWWPVAVVRGVRLDPEWLLDGRGWITRCTTADAAGCGWTTAHDFVVLTAGVAMPLASFLGWVG